MAKKRDFSQVDSPGAEQQAFATNERGQSNKKRKHDGKTKHRPSEGSSEWAKKRVRNIDRLLKRNSELPANVRNDLEREMAALRSTVSDKSFQKKRSAMITKYHMVRFFERKKAMRLAKKLRRRIEETESPEEIEELKKDLHVAEVDEAYTQHYPHIEAYVSLYTTSKASAADDEETASGGNLALLKTPRPPMWSTIEQAMEEGPNALRQIREKRPVEDPQDQSRQQRLQKPKGAQKAAQKEAQNTPDTSKPPKRPPPVLNNGAAQNGKPQTAQTGLNRRERRRLMREAMPPAAKSDDDDDSDEGGFFEEG